MQFWIEIAGCIAIATLVALLMLSGKDGGDE